MRSSLGCQPRLAFSTPRCTPDPHLSPTPPLAPTLLLQPRLQRAPSHPCRTTRHLADSAAAAACTSQPPALTHCPTTTLSPSASVAWTSLHCRPSRVNQSSQSSRVNQQQRAWEDAQSASAACTSKLTSEALSMLFLFSLARRMSAICGAAVQLRLSCGSEQGTHPQRTPQLPMPARRSPAALARPPTRRQRTPMPCVVRQPGSESHRERRLLLQLDHVVLRLQLDLKGVKRSAGRSRRES
jgi:hypothetical protein